MSISLMNPCVGNNKNISIVFVKQDAKANTYSFTDTFEGYDALLFTSAWEEDPSRLYVRPNIGTVKNVQGPYPANFIVNGLNKKKVLITFYNLDSGYNTWYVYGIKEE